MMLLNYLCNSEDGTLKGASPTMQPREGLLLLLRFGFGFGFGFGLALAYAFTGH
jgi:hypothetical protein